MLLAFGALQKIPGGLGQTSGPLEMHGDFAGGVARFARFAGRFVQVHHRAGHVVVEPLALLDQQGAVGDLADQGVAEEVCQLLPGVAHGEPRGFTFGRGLPQCFETTRQEGLDEPLVEAPADDAGQTENLRGGRAQAVHAGEDGGEDVDRQPLRDVTATRDPPVPAAHDESPLDEVQHELFEEEGVALGLLQDPPADFLFQREPVQELVADAPDFVPELPEYHLLGPQAGERPLSFINEAALPAGRGHQHRTVGSAAGLERGFQYGAGGLVGQMEVVDGEK